MVPPTPWSLPPPKKPGKIRVVFDCSAEYKGETLNKHLLQGPDLTNKLVGVLSRFRQETVAFMADIQWDYFYRFTWLNIFEIYYASSGGRMTT